ncbi:MAG: DUF6305 family protein [Deltaproteobacteria bacterium]|jgi:hypothetical protein|nr:DUF6305 family protein [Deltaproteobacteria bacterium]
MSRLSFLVVFGLSLLGLVFSGAAPAAELPTFAEPVLFTSLGQSPDAKTFSVLAGRAKLKGEFLTLAKGSDIEAAKTVFVTVGTSLKGFGSAGVNLESETARCEEIVKAAKAKGVYLVLVHIGGEGRRDSMTNLLLEKLAPSADAFIVYENGNGDGYFTLAAGEKPLALLAKTLDVVKLLEAKLP